MPEVQTIDQMREAYKGEWVLVADCEDDESGQLVRGRVVAHSLDRDDVYRAMGDYSDGDGVGYLAVEYFGKIPADLYYML